MMNVRKTIALVSILGLILLVGCNNASPTDNGSMSADAEVATDQNAERTDDTDRPTTVDWLKIHKTSDKVAWSEEPTESIELEPGKTYVVAVSCTAEDLGYTGNEEQIATTVLMYPRQLQAGTEEALEAGMVLSHTDLPELSAKIRLQAKQDLKLKCEFTPDDVDVAPDAESVKGTSVVFVAGVKNVKNDLLPDELKTQPCVAILGKAKAIITMQTDGISNRPESTKLLYFFLETEEA